jgi:hypothetical protein
LGGVAFGAIQPPHGPHAGEAVTVTIQPEDCNVLSRTAWSKNNRLSR